MSNKAKPLPAEVIKDALEIDPKSKSWLRWKVRPRTHFRTESAWKRWNSTFSNKEAGAITDHGGGKRYFRVKINQTEYKAHRLVYFFTTGNDPHLLHMDHIDGDGTNNNPINLRLATNTQNGMNRKKQHSNSSGRRGVYWNKEKLHWRSRIHINGKSKFLGYFKNLNDASAAYEAAAREHFGEFYREGRTDALAQH